MCHLVESKSSEDPKMIWKDIVNTVGVLLSSYTHFRRGARANAFSLVATVKTSALTRVKNTEKNNWKLINK